MERVHGCTLAEALGYRPPGSTARSSKLTDDDIREATRRETEPAADDGDRRIQGLGFGSRQSPAVARSDRAGFDMEQMQGSGNMPPPAAAPRI